MPTESVSGFVGKIGVQVKRRVPVALKNGAVGADEFDGPPLMMSIKNYRFQLSTCPAFFFGFGHLLMDS